MLEAEVMVMKNMLTFKIERNLESIKKHIEKNLTAILYKLIQIATFLLICSAAYACSYSAMRRIKCGPKLQGYKIDYPCVNYNH